MLPVWVRLALLGGAYLARVLLDVNIFEANLPVLLAENPAPGLLLVPLLLVPMLALAGARVVSALWLILSGLALPVALLVPLPFLPAVLLVGGASILFQVVALAEFAALCLEHRWSWPRCLGILLALLLVLRWFGGLTGFPPVALLTLAVVTPLLAVLATGLGSPGGHFSLAVRVLLGPTPARALLLAMLAFLLLVIAGLGNTTGETRPAALLGAGIGALLAAGQRNLWRCPGLIPIAGLALALTQALLALVGTDATWLWGLYGLATGLGLVPLLASFVGATPAPVRAVALTWGAGLALPLLATAFWLAPGLGWLALLGLGFTILAATWLLPQLFEQGLEIVGSLLWQVDITGPGAGAVPGDGPLILVANHSAYFDPLWVCKWMPRKVTPMMTSVFYDLPVMRWFMVHAAQAIRVPAATFRREAPELQEAIRVLQLGGCVLIFPEARLRKSEDRLLFPFGQGLWHILKAMPEARVMPVWIEGGWGSWTSHANGQPPLKGKPFDFLRKIRLGISRAEVVSPGLLADREAFRMWLMEQVLGCREHLGLPVPTVEQALGRDSGPPDDNPHQNDSETGGNR
jgi:1-acyl-sn-glycerol-3-phosphate acyltransferase